MSKIVLNDKAWMKAMKDLPLIEVKIFLTLCFASDAGNAVTFKTMDMVDASGLCRVTFNRALKGLSDRKLIRIHTRKCGVAGTTEISISKWFCKAVAS
jgi:CRP-like cAMP-binding protein